MMRISERIKLGGGIKKCIVRFFTKGRANRSVGGTLFLLFFISIFAVFSLFPVIYMAGSAFKPLQELHRYPPTLLPQNPTWKNFSDLLRYANESFVPFSRYLFNTGILVVACSAGQIVFSAAAAYPLAKFDFRGRQFLDGLVVYALMFSGTVTAVPNYIIMNKMGLIDSLWAIILPTLASSLGLYLLKNFMLMIPDALIEAARIDGAGHFKILLQVVMPVIKPALMTVFIFTFQNIWGNTGGSFLYTESIKPLSYMISKIAAAGIARQGMAAAAALLMFIIPLIIFINAQSNVMETMASSGMKD